MLNCHMIFFRIRHLIFEQTCGVMLQLQDPDNLKTTLVILLLLLLFWNTVNRELMRSIEI